VPEEEPPVVTPLLDPLPVLPLLPALPLLPPLPLVPGSDGLPLDAALFMVVLLPGGVVDADGGPLLAHPTSIMKAIRACARRIRSERLEPRLESDLVVIIIRTPSNASGQGGTAALIFDCAETGDSRATFRHLLLSH